MMSWKGFPDNQYRVALACFTPLQFELLKIAADDKDALHDTYAEWRAAMDATQKLIVEQGLQVREIDVDVPTLVEWCKERGIPVDGGARSRYASFVASQEQEPLG